MRDFWKWEKVTGGKTSIMSKNSTPASVRKTRKCSEGHLWDIYTDHKSDKDARKVFNFAFRNIINQDEIKLTSENTSLRLPQVFRRALVGHIHRP